MWESSHWLFPGQCRGCDARADGRLCAACRTLSPRATPPPAGIGWAVALADYDGGLALALRRAKYGADLPLMWAVAEAFADGAAPLAVGFDAIVPVPSPWTRRVARGFSPAAVLAAAVERRTGVPAVSALRLAPGPRQAGVEGRQRRSNLRGRLRSTHAVRGRVLLVDDVSTTGATLAASSRELLGDATERVCAVVLATPSAESP